MIQGEATAKYTRTSAQKAGLVLDLIRGCDVNKALALLQFSRKHVARDIAKVLRSAIANAQQKEGFGGDVDRLYVKACFANQGPSMKRIRPAPMGRAFHVIKRTAHLTVHVAERPQAIAAVVPETKAPRRRVAAAKAPAETPAATPDRAPKAPKAAKAPKSPKAAKAAKK
jgi:large subunit ribosomal protein L22